MTPEERSKKQWLEAQIKQNKKHGIDRIERDLDEALPDKAKVLAVIAKHQRAAINACASVVHSMCPVIRQKAPQVDEQFHMLCDSLIEISNEVYQGLTDRATGADLVPEEQRKVVSLFQGALPPRTETQH